MLMFLTAAALGVLVPVATGEFHYFQPSERPGALADLIRPTNEHPAAAVAYFTIDSGFVIAFVLVFVGLFSITRLRAPEFAVFALGAGIWTGVMDAVENGIYWGYAMRALTGVRLAEFDIPLLPLLSNLKMIGFFATYLTFALILPRRDWLERVAAVVMLLPPTVGLVSVAVRDLGDVRPLLIALPSVPLALVFARAWFARTEPPDPVSS
ncbi:MAG: hypothetical protein ACRDQF_07485 [Thermocrispum sp.]